MAGIKAISNRVSQAAAAATQAVHANQVVLSRVEGMASDIEDPKV